jgi:hypothetical protein
MSEHPIWVACHTVDYDESWYDQTDEETFRPWTGARPVGADAMYLVSCTFRLSDGAAFAGFATPADQSDDLGTMQPQLFDTSGRRHAFWLGMFPVEAEIESFRAALSRPSNRVFPIHFGARSGLTRAACGGSIRGFMKSSDSGAEVLKLTW